MDNAKATCWSDLVNAYTDLTSGTAFWKPEQFQKKIFKNVGPLVLIGTKEIYAKIKFPHLYDRTGKFRS